MEEKSLKKFFGILGLGILLLLIILVVQTLRFTSKQLPAEEIAVIDIDAQGAVQRFAKSITFPTISNQDPAKTDSTAFRNLHVYFERTYPRVHQNLNRELVAGLSLLYTWQGKEPNLDPIVLMGHFDVVPIASETADKWSYPPFGGNIEDGYIWGRGAMDDKCSVVSILEAVEALVNSGFQPRRTVYLAFGHDEEIGGRKGAQAIVETLRSRGVENFAFVLDEGGAITDGMIPGLAGPTAIIGIAEKGSVTIRLKVEVTGGHSSMPPNNTSVGILTKAITRLEENQFPAALEGASLKMLETIGPEMSFLPRMFLANLWLFKPLIEWQLSGNPQTASMLRTTTAATMFNAGVKSNVLPPVSTAIVNFRIRPGETVESVKERVRRVIDDDRVEVIAPGGREPSPVSDPDSPAFNLIAKTLRQIIPDDDLVVTPYLVMGGTDARYYSQYSTNVYRFLPFRLSNEDMSRLHGVDERMAIDSFVDSIKFFYQLLKNSQEI